MKNEKIPEFKQEHLNSIETAVETSMVVKGTVKIPFWKIGKFFRHLVKKKK